MEDITPSTVLEVDYIEVDMPTPARQSCSSCDDARARLGHAIEQVEPLLRDLGTRIEVRELKVRTGSEAELLRLRGSPTVRIAGLDLHPEHHGADGEERVWRWRGREYRNPPAGLFAEAILAASKCMVQSASYEIPPYLRQFVTEHSPA